MCVCSMYILSCLCFWKHVVCTVLYVCDEIFIVRYQTIYVCTVCVCVY